MCAGTVSAMTLLESIVALVVFGLAAIGFLELFQRVQASAVDAVAWTRAVDVAEATLERAALGEALVADDTLAGLRRRVRIVPYAARLRRVTVTVELPAPQRGEFELHRLVPAQ
jgi:type II secretory pathway pseudopilin PulG